MLPPAEFYDDVLREGVGVEEHGDEGCWEVEEAVFEGGEEDEFGCGGGLRGRFAGGHC